MSNERFEAQAEAEAYPSYASFRRRATIPLASVEARRLMWTLDGPLTSLMVMNDGRDPDGPLEPYFQQTISGTKWHPIADMPLTRHKISSVAVTLSAFTRWAEDWEQAHQHAEPGDPGCVFGEAEDDETDPPLLRCCGESRPRDTAPLLVRASEQPYVTIHDYVSAVHPWLMDLKDKIRSAMGVWDGRAIPRNKKLVVINAGNDNLKIRDWNSWLIQARQRAYIPVSNAV